LKKISRRDAHRLRADLIFSTCPRHGGSSRRNGGEVIDAPAQNAGGSLHAKERLDARAELARRTLTHFAGNSSTPIHTNAGGCGSHLEALCEGFAMIRLSDAPPSLGQERDGHVTSGRGKIKVSVPGTTRTRNSQLEILATIPICPSVSTGRRSRRSDADFGARIPGLKIVELPEANGLWQRGNLQPDATSRAGKLLQPQTDSH